MQSLSPSGFWAYSLEVYQRPEVKRLCLELQDDYGTDINMLLFACWLGQTGRGSLACSAWRAMVLRTGKWRDEVILPLRQVRHLLKHEQLAPVGMGEKVFECELMAEQVEQQLLEREWGVTRHPLVNGSMQRTEDMLKNLVAYLEGEKIPLNSKLAYRIERLVRQVSGLLDDRFIHQTCYRLMGLERGRDPGESRLDLTMP